MTSAPFPLPAEVHFPGWFHLVYFGLVIPLAVVRRRRHFLDQAAPLPDRVQHFRSALLTIVMLTFVSLVVAKSEGIALFPRRLPSWISVLVGFGLYGLAVACMIPRWREAVKKRVRIVHLFMPANSPERIWWVGLAAIAGLGEEISWRGVQVALWVGVTGEYWLATLASCISFAISHAIQGWRSVLVIAGFALGFQTLVWIAGSLYVAMAVHIAYDITAGLMYGKLGKRLGYPK